MVAYVLSAFLLIVAIASMVGAQDGKMELAVYAGGFFNTGFQSYRISNPATGQTMQTFKPVSEPNSVIFGIRGSYWMSPRITAEGTFGFSPAGRSQNSIVFGIPGPILTTDSSSRITFPSFSPYVAGGDVFLVNGVLLAAVTTNRTWTPFLLAGAGAITRTGDVRFVPNPLAIGSPSSQVSIFLPSVIVASPNRTAMTLVLGAGFKKRITSRFGIRLDFRDHINTFDGSTVNNLETSLGIFAF